MNFEFKVSDTFNIIGRGTVLAGELLQGQIKSGDKLLTDDDQQIHVSGIEIVRPGKVIGLLVRYDYVKSKELIGKILKKI
ncbi:MAG: hypothetical protein K0R18_19 [Bacillales bacterium]|nr:hypothetical protein [Bacillales bacterium]